mgnify:FL=1
MNIIPPQSPLFKGTREENIAAMQRYLLELSDNLPYLLNDSIAIDDVLSASSANPVQNKVIKAALDDKLNKSDVEDKLDGSSKNPVQNKTITVQLQTKFDKYGGDINGDVRLTNVSRMNTAAKKIAVFTNSNIIEYRTASELAADLGIGDDPSSIADLVYPVGSIYMSVNSTDPAQLFGGSWTQLEDRFLLGAGTSYTNGRIGGAATCQLTAANLPRHTHPQYVATSGGSESANLDYASYSTSAKTVAQGIPTGATGSGTAFDILPPYLVVYMWKRTA